MSFILDGLKHNLEGKELPFAKHYIETVLTPLMWNNYNVAELNKLLNVSSFGLSTLKEALDIFIKDRLTNPYRMYKGEDSYS